MRIVVQRVLRAHVQVDGLRVSEIGKGLLLLCCLEQGDGKEQLEKALQKMVNLRIFEDAEGRMNKNITQAGGVFLCVSQFTLAWKGEKGHRPSFDRSMAPQEAKELFDLFCKQLDEHVPTKKGVFGADMKVELVGDGPVTFCFDF